MDRIAFGPIRAGDPRSYVETLLRGWWTDEGAPDYAAAVEEVLSAGGVCPTIHAEADIAPRDDAEADERRVRIACLLHMMRGALPLQDGETIEEMQFTSLAEDFDDAPAGSVACLRRTNLADIYLMPTGWSVRDRKLVFTPPEEPEPLDIQTTMLASTGTDLALSFAKGLLSGIGGKVGAQLFDAIIPSGPPSYFDQVYKEIDKLMKSNLDQNTVDTMDGEMNGLRTWVTNSYEAFKSSGYTKQQLHDQLDPKVSNLSVNVLGVLSQKSFAEPGLRVFMVAAGFHLSLLQELALQDPNESDPKKSAYAKQVVNYAKTYAGHVTKTYDDIVKKRKSFIHTRYSPQQVCTAATCRTIDGYDYVDEYVGLYGPRFARWQDDNKDWHDGSKRAQAACNSYEIGILAKLESDLEYPPIVVAEWKKLEAKPLP